MKNSKKFIYPFIFSICFFLTYIILVNVLNIVLPSGDYAGIAYAAIALILWMLIIVPIYCAKYSKIIQNEKRKFLFAIYNPLVISLSYTGPFLMPTISTNDVDILISIAIALFLWVAICTFIPLLIRLNSAKKQEQNLEEIELPNPSDLE